MISVISPVFNEKESLPELHQRITRVLKNREYELIFVNDGSIDGSEKILERILQKDPHVRLISFKKNQGKSNALMSGFAAATGETIVTLDADLQDQPEEIPKLVGQLRDYDLVSGWKKKRNDPLANVLFSRIFNGFIGLTTGVRLHDVNCGLKGYKRAVTERLTLYGDLYRFIPVMAAREGFKVGEIEVSHAPRKYGHSKYGFSKFVRGFFDLFTVLFLTNFNMRPLHLFGSLGGAMLAAGTLLCLYLTVIWFSGQEIGRRPLLILGILLIITGIQLFTSGLLAELIIYRQKTISDENKSR